MSGGADKAFFVNGVLEPVLLEIIESCRGNSMGTRYLQPRSTKMATFLKDTNPSPKRPIMGYFSISTQLSEVTYTAEIIGWEDKRELSETRRAELDTIIQEFQPKEKGLQLISVDGKEYIDLIAVRNLQQLKLPMPVTDLIKVSDRKPHGIRAQAGGRSVVFLMPPLYREEQVQKQLHSNIADSQRLTPDARKRRLNIAQRQPERVQIVSIGYIRNPDVITEVLLRANGNCERCANPAPFNRSSDGTPYLEVHHIVHLASGGEDTVANTQALCPNCHREVHFG